MNGLLEFMFEAVPADQVGPMVQCISISESNIVELIHSEIDDHLTRNMAMRLDFWEGFCVTPGNATCFINLNKSKINDVFVNNISIMVIHYNDITDVSILASSEDCKSVNIRTAEEFYSWAKELGGSFKVLHYYGGLEPAFDEETQLYSDKGIGLITEL